MGFTDPRAASSTVIDGSADLIGDEVVKVEPVVLDGETIFVPAGLPGAPEYRAVLRAEQTADALRAEIVDSLDRRGELPVANITLALDFRDTAGTAVASGAVGLESYANFHLERLVPNGQGGELADGKEYSLRQLRSLPLSERFSKALPGLLHCAPPTDQPWWEALRRVHALAVLQRHAINEPHKRKGLRGESGFLQRLYAAEYRGTAQTMLATFEYFSPGWIDTQRRQALSSP
jgi:hypothetical protein